MPFFDRYKITVHEDGEGLIRSQQNVHYLNTNVIDIGIFFKGQTLERYQSFILLQPIQKARCVYIICNKH